MLQGNTNNRHGRVGPHVRTMAKMELLNSTKEEYDKRFASEDNIDRIREAGHAERIEDKSKVN